MRLRVGWKRWSSDDHTGTRNGNPARAGLDDILTSAPLRYEVYNGQTEPPTCIVLTCSGVQRTVYRDGTESGIYF
jgi:hypothetical protein